MLDRKGFGLGECFAGNGSDMRFCAIQTNVIDQLGHFIRRSPAQRRFGGFPARGIGQTDGVYCQIFDLACGNNQLAAHTTGFKTGGGFAQHRQFTRQIICGYGNFANLTPAARCPVQQRDAFEGKRKSKIRLHALPLTRFDVPTIRYWSRIPHTGVQEKVRRRILARAGGYPPRGPYGPRGKNS